jgi:hypothetical protein
MSGYLIVFLQQISTAGAIMHGQAGQSGAARILPKLAVLQVMRLAEIYKIEYVRSGGISDL